MVDNIESVAGGNRRHIKTKKIGFKFFGFSFLIIIVILLVGVGGYFLYKSATSSAIDNTRYQAVFLTNGQVYFGKLKMLNGGYMKLNDIYYLQTKAKSAEAGLQDSSDSSTDVTLIKLGNEIHGPEDEMIISKDQILFFENMKSNSTVSLSIEKQKQN